MGTIYVKTMDEMSTLNHAFWRRTEIAKRNILQQLATINYHESKRIADEVKFKGVLSSMIEINQANQFKFRVIASAPHAFEIEMGQPEHGKGQYVSFDESPLLEMWVMNKLMNVAPQKAKYFLNKRAVKIGGKGFPYGYPNGLRFMENGLEVAYQISDTIISEELNKLG